MSGHGADGAKDGEQQGGEDAEDGEDDEQLYECEAWSDPWGSASPRQSLVHNVSPLNLKEIALLGVLQDELSAWRGSPNPRGTGQSAVG